MARSSVVPSRAAAIEPRPDHPPTRRWPLAAVVAGAVAVRVAVMVGGLGRLDDPDHYLTLARSLAEGRGFVLDGRPTAYRPPLYPMLLAPLVGGLPGGALPLGVRALHLILGAGTVALAHATARRWGLSPGRALLASGVVAFDPVLVVQARSVMTETPSAFLVAATLAALTARGRWGAVLGGIGFGLAGLCRPSLLPGAGLAALASLVVGPGSGRERLSAVGPAGTRHGGDAGSLGRPECPGLRRADRDDHAWRLHAGPGQQPGVLRGRPGRAAGRRLVGAASGGVVRVGRPGDGGDVRAGGRPGAPDRAWALARGRPRDFARASLARLGRLWGWRRRGRSIPAGSGGSPPPGPCRSG